MRLPFEASDNPVSVLFVCSSNNDRSLMAEAIANQQFSEQLAACSAGVQPARQPDPLAMQTLRKHGLRTDGLTCKPLSSVADRHFDLVVHLCDSAHDQHSAEVPGVADQAQWHLPDPGSADNPQAMHEAVFDAIVEAMGVLLFAPHPAMKGRALEAARQLSRRFAPKAA